jgi:hypothetical protein
VSVFGDGFAVRCSAWGVPEGIAGLGEYQGDVFGSFPFVPFLIIFFEKEE